MLFRSGAQPIIGYNYGARKFKRVRQTYFLGLFWCTIILAISYACIYFFPEALIRMFNDDPNLTEIALGGIRTYLAVLPLIGIQMTASNYFQAVGKPKFAMLNGLTRQVIYLIPALFIFPTFWGLKGVWYAGPFADALAVITGSCIMLFEFKKMRKQEVNVDEEIPTSELD